MAPVEEDLPGYWGKATATIDWCEANYEVSQYIAEFWNTISNFFMVVPPLIGTFLAVKDGFERRFVWCQITLVLVGIGSTCFHGTLLYEMQLLDELPMVWGSALLVYALIQVDGTPRKPNHRLGAFLTIYCIVVTIVYLTVKNPIFHQFAYGALVLGMIASSLRIVRKFEHSRTLFLTGLLTYAVGFAIWASDQVFCSNLRFFGVFLCIGDRIQWSGLVYIKSRGQMPTMMAAFWLLRSQVSPGLRPVLQGHAWWHVLAGVGTYISLLFNMHARQRYLNRTPRIQMMGGVWPYVRQGTSV